MITKQEYAALEQAVEFFKKVKDRGPDDRELPIRKMESALNKLARELVRS